MSPTEPHTQKSQTRQRRSHYDSRIESLYVTVDEKECPFQDPSTYRNVVPPKLQSSFTVSEQPMFTTTVNLQSGSRAKCNRRVGAGLQRASEKHLLENQ
eukprot:3396818-Rhodomonas_salina.1